MQQIKLGTASAAVLLLALCATAEGQPGRYPAGAAVHADVPAPAPDTNAVRSGLTFGATIGRGSLDVGCDGCGDLSTLSEGLSVSAHVGVMLTPRLALLGEAWMVRYKDRDTFWFGDSDTHEVRHTLLTAAAQYWVLPRLWVRGGLGIARHYADTDYRSAPGGTIPVFREPTVSPIREDGSISSVGAAWRLGAGFELAASEKAAFELQLNVGGSKGKDQSTTLAAIGVGLSWF